ncbi:proteoglycan 4-like [Schistocerca gregaria]|uniref:proteoglycan 4-like n=1 Tax=Schistocerca gregaria TaxID=7010 RepID=UPI00211E54DB|nr:proteoglycan 4-like [Schistocerca gregaria]XP_049841371.1 proteoglycan 4-like [Schistocerca gregaria]
MRPSECPVVERRVDIPIKCKELELLKSCVEHTAVVVINRLHQDSNDGPHLEQQETWLEALPVSPHATPSKSQPPNKEVQLYSPKQLRPHSPKPSESHLPNHSQAQSARHPYVQTPRQSFPLSPRQVHPQTPRQSLRQPVLQPLEESHPVSPKQALPQPLSHTQPQYPRHTRPGSPRHSDVQSPNQSHPASPRHSQAQTLSQSHKQSHPTSPRQSHPRTLWYSQSQRAAHQHSPKEPHRPLLRQPQFTPQKLSQEPKETRSPNELWPDRPKQPQFQLQKQLVVHVEKLPGESPKCELQERQHAPSPKQQQNSLQKELYVQLEKLAGEPQAEVKHQTSPSPRQAQFPQPHVQLEKLTEDAHQLEPAQHQSPPAKQHDGLVLNQLHIKLEKLPDDSWTLEEQHQPSSPGLVKPKELHIQLEKLPLGTENCEVKQQEPSFSNRLPCLSHSPLQDQLATQVEEKQLQLLPPGCRYTIPAPEPVATRQRVYLQQLVDTQQKWGSPVFQPRVVLERLSPKRLASTLHVRVALRRLSSEVLKKYGIQQTLHGRLEQKPAIDIDDEDWFDLERQEWTLCSILQAREKSVFAIWRAVNMPRKPRKKHVGVNGFVRKPARINKITFMSKLGLKRRHL